MEGDVITLQDIYVFRQTGIDKDGIIKGKFEATSIRPKFIDKLIASGLSLPAEILSHHCFRGEVFGYGPDKIVILVFITDFYWFWELTQ